MMIRPTNQISTTRYTQDHLHIPRWTNNKPDWSHFNW